MDKDYRDYPDPRPCGVSQPYRENAITALQRKAKQLRMQAHNLEKLADELSRRGLSPDADEALWGLLYK